MCTSYPGCWAAVSVHGSFLPCYGTQAESETSAHELRVLPHPGSWWGNRTMLDTWFVSSRANVSDVMLLLMLSWVWWSTLGAISGKISWEKKHYCTTMIPKEDSVRLKIHQQRSERWTKCSIIIAFCLFCILYNQGCTTYVNTELLGCLERSVQPVFGWFHTGGFFFFLNMHCI